jgi:hypothetical protein
MKEFKIAFWTPGTGILQNQQLFGCASHGFATDSAWVEPEKGECSFWKETIIGTVFTGGYKNVLTSLGKCNFMPKVCIAFFRKSLGVEQFILKFRELLPNVPVIGGGAAIGEGQNMGDVLPLAEEVVLLAAAEGEFDLQTLNIYNQTNMELEINITSDRSFDKVRLLPDGKWQSALDFFHEQKKIRGISQEDFESITFHDLNRRNIHCSIKEDKVLTGANLPDNGRLVLCVVDRKEATRHLSEFISVERSLVIGCAGIRSLVQKPLTAGKDSLAGFLFGEVVSFNNQPMFGNLMLVRLTRK